MSMIKIRLNAPFLRVPMLVLLHDKTPFPGARPWSLAVYMLFFKKKKKT